MKPAKPREVWLDGGDGAVGPHAPGAALYRKVIPETPAQKRVRLARVWVLNEVRRGGRAASMANARAELLEAEAAERRERRAKR